MYEDKQSYTFRWILCVLVFLAVVVEAAVVFSRNAGAEIRDEAARSISEAIRRTALQCFTVEGVYPESLEYMQENYGLQVNTKDYYVVYEVFADNQPPSVRVARKEG